MDYSRQELLGFVGKSGQGKINNSCVAVVGAGGVGCSSLQLLALAGIGRLIIIDRDVVESSNLYRQPLFSQNDVGRPKADAAREALQKLNTEVRVSSLCQDLDFRNIGSVLDGADVVLDCTDNMEARFLINEFCMKNGVPWVYSGSVRDSGTVMAFVPGGPCFRCVFSDLSAGSFEGCDVVGSANFATSAAASFQVSECLKVLLGSSAGVGSSMLRFDLWASEFEKIEVVMNYACPVCAGRYEYLSGSRGSRAVKLCGSGTYQVKGTASLDSLRQSLSGSSYRDFGSCISFGDVTLFADGRAIVRASSESDARSRYSRVVG
ncbi:HesA/MoeB/ThiF family protein [Candidatus Woesearchaeota archaeon]|nr:HesA/MoeB/ThiF family protein [Candidatus Woesearchaeota archaeon]